MLRLLTIKVCLVALVSLLLPVQAQVEEAHVMDVAKELACLCGSCPTRP